MPSDLTGPSPPSPAAAVEPRPLPTETRPAEAPIRWGMIGCGAVTEVKSGPAFRLARGSTLHAVASRNFAAAQDYARRHGVPNIHEGIDALINSVDVDAVYIATPPGSHCELALAVARAGKPCCVEKPMARDHRECLQMVSAFADRGLPLFVAYYRRSLPRFVQVKDWLQKALIGQVLDVRWHLLRPRATLRPNRQPPWRADPQIAPGGYFVDLACHGLDLFQFLLGDISAARAISVVQAGAPEAEAGVSACWAFDCGAIGSGSWHFGADRREDTVQIIGTKGSITFSVFDDEPLRLRTAAGDHSVFIGNPPNIQLNHVEGMVRHLKAGVPHPSTGIDAAKTNLVLSWMLADAHASRK